MSSDASASVAAYERLLESVGREALTLGERPIVGHWPHVGSAYRGLLIVGQAVYGWPDDHPASQFATAGGRAEAIRAFRARNAKEPEPLGWIVASHHRSSPWWNAVRLLVDELEPGPTPWYARFAWANLYPVAPGDLPGNPGGSLREAQDPFVGDLLRAELDMLEARTIIALVGPYWWPTGSASYFAALPEQPRPLIRAGRIEGRSWVVGWLPTGASRRGWGPRAYADIIARAARDGSDKR